MKKYKATVGIVSPDGGHKDTELEVTSWDVTNGALTMELTDGSISVIAPGWWGAVNVEP